VVDSLEVAVAVVVAGDDVVYAVGAWLAAEPADVPVSLEDAGGGAVPSSG
jgi:hypothetical protein